MNAVISFVPDVEVDVAHRLEVAVEPTGRRLRRRIDLGCSASPDAVTFTARTCRGRSAGRAGSRRVSVGCMCSPRVVVIGLRAHHAAGYRLRMKMATEFIASRMHQQHDDGRGRENLELVLRLGGPVEDLDREHRERDCRARSGLNVTNVEAPEQQQGRRLPDARGTARGWSRSRYRGWPQAAPDARPSATASHRERSEPCRMRLRHGADRFARGDDDRSAAPPASA